MKEAILLFIIFLTFNSCEGDDNRSPGKTDKVMYFPSETGAGWETTSISELGWNQGAVQPLRDFLIAKNSKAFMILVNGRIVMEEYFDGHSASSSWEWNSAGKTLVGTTTGIAQQDLFLNISNSASSYLGAGWTNMSSEKENLITVKHLLTMTSGIDDTKQLIVKQNLTYIADAGTRWAYGNVFQMLINVVSAAGNRDFETYFNERLKDRIGMDGYWNFGPVFTIYHSTARSMARFGLLALNKGKWKDEQIVAESFFTESASSSQDLNPSYGYFWWLNGKTKYMLPGGQTIYNGPLVPNAPSDMYAAMGAADQRLYVIPGKKMVVVRMGNASDPANPSFAVSGFDNDLWGKINSLINQ